MTSDFRTRLKRGDKLLGTMVTLGSPAAAEILADIGFDWLFVDGEHGPLDVRQVRQIQGAQRGHLRQRLADRIAAVFGLAVVAVFEYPHGQA